MGSNFYKLAEIEGDTGGVTEYCLLNPFGYITKWATKQRINSNEIIQKEHYLFWQYLNDMRKLFKLDLKIEIGMGR